jgi:hypothetical protein
MKHPVWFAFWMAFAYAGLQYTVCKFCYDRGFSKGIQRAREIFREAVTKR